MAAPVFLQELPTALRDDDKDVAAFCEWWWQLSGEPFAQLEGRCMKPSEKELNLREEEEVPRLTV